MSREKQVLVLLFITIFVLWLIRSMIIVDLYFDGIALDTVQLELTKIQKENLGLEDEYLQDSSLQILMQKARHMGFIDASYAVLYKDHVEIVKPHISGGF